MLVTPSTANRTNLHAPSPSATAAAIGGSIFGSTTKRHQQPRDVQRMKTLLTYLVVFVVAFTCGKFQSAVTSGSGGASGGGSGLGSTIAASEGASKPEVEVATISAVVDRKCTPSEREFQSQVRDAARARGCQAKDFPVLRIVHMHMPDAKVFVDVGSNKGYAAAEWYELWSPEFGVSRKKLKQIYSVPANTSGSVMTAELQGKAGYFTECGGCNECREEVSSLLLTTKFSRACTNKAASTTSGRDAGKRMSEAADKLCENLATRYLPIRVFSFDANPNMVEGVTRAIRKLDDLPVVNPVPPDIPVNRWPNKLPKVSEVWHVENLVLTSPRHAGKNLRVTLNEGELGRIELVPPPQGRVDDERSATFWVKIDKENPKYSEPVPADTIDNMLQKKLGSDVKPFIDVLKIDVEGHDVDVLEGAHKTIQEHRVTVVKFEYGALWHGRLLKQVISGLDQLKYACYFEGKNGLLKLTSGCWHDALESKFWSNVWCVSLTQRQGVAIANALDGLTLAFWYK